MLKRELYLKRIRPFYDEDLIKVLVGIRRSGKSELLKQIKDELIDNGILIDNIIYINFEDLSFANIKTEIDLFNYINEHTNTDSKYYFLFDEIQTVSNFEKAINSFKATMNCSIFITGSNGKLLSGEFATLLSGRYVEFKIMPFSFAEVITYKGLKTEEDINTAFLDYLRWGGMPQRFNFKSESETRVYFDDLYNSIVLKDIIMRSKIKDINLLNKVIDYLLQNTSQIFSANSITKFLKKEKRTMSTETIYNYLSYILASLLVNKVSRFDIKNKKILETFEKYYCSDLGLLQTKKYGTSIDLGACLETIVYNHLISLGYDVYVGKTTKGEVDFIVTNNNQKFYIQVVYLLADDSTIQREFGAYKDIDDNYPKYVISTDKFDFSRNGIIHKNIVEFLLDRNA